jgi:threonine/homoserine/homoserine lactone efflux protein
MVENWSMPDAHTLLLFAAGALVLLIVPGPSVIYIVTRSVSHGRRAGIASMLGIQTGSLVHVAAAAAGVSALLASSATAFSLVKYAGAAYLILLGVRNLMERHDPEPTPPSSRSNSHLFWHGVVVNVLNPKTAIFFVAFFPQFVDPSKGPVALQMVVLGLCFVVLGILSDGSYALAASAATRLFRRNVRRRRRLSRLSGGIYIGLGAVTALSSTRAIR